ncbi:response regulator transcription factor [Rhabdobacter roseus]
MPNEHLYLLTQREWIVLLYVAADFSNTAIADKLCITGRSVINYRNRIGDKLQLKGRSTLGYFARRNIDHLKYSYTIYWGKLPISSPYCPDID